MTQDDPESILASVNCSPTSAQNAITEVRNSIARASAAGVPRRAANILTVKCQSWRTSCLERVGHIPSGYTYLAQLMGHDMGCSVPLASVPHVPRAPGVQTGVLGGENPVSRYNLIENPLTLETIYGAGPVMLPHLYDTRTMRFRVRPSESLASVHPEPATVDSVRALYDERNRDTLMLHELAVAWMQYHNLTVDRLMAKKARPQMQAYAEARSHAVRVWHGIVRNDLLPRYLHPAIANLDEASLSPEWMLDEATLLFGLFRAFHSMPLAGYRFSGSGPHNLDRLMKRNYLPSFAERNWQVGWDQFFGAIADGPKTGISASVSGELLSAARLVALLDIASAKRVDPLSVGNAPGMSMIASLPEDWPIRITPSQLAQDFAAKFSQAPDLPDDVTLSNGPLYLFLMIEAQCHGVTGGFGPLGSALLRTSVLGSIGRVALTVESPDLAEYEQPKTMLELLKLVRRTEEWPNLNM